MTIFTEAWRATGAWRFPSPAAFLHRSRACVHARLELRRAILAKRGRLRFGKGHARGLPSTGACPARTFAANPPLHSWQKSTPQTDSSKPAFQPRLRRQGAFPARTFAADPPLHSAMDCSRSNMVLSCFCGLQLADDPRLKPMDLLPQLNLL